MKARNFLLVSFVLALGVGSAFADTTPPAGAARSISFQEFKDRCANPDKYKGDVQRAPENIKIRCTDISHAYVADQSGSLPLADSRSVITALYSDKFNVDADTKVFALDAASGSCLRYKEIEKTLAVEKALSCAEILGLKGDIDSFCAENLDSLKSANPKLIEAKDTGNVIDTCGGAAVRGGKGPGQ